MAKNGSDQRPPNADGPADVGTPTLPDPQGEGAVFGDWREQLRDRVKEIRARKLAGKHWDEDSETVSLTEQASADAAEKLRATLSTTMTAEPAEPPAAPASTSSPVRPAAEIDAGIPETPEDLDAAIEEALDAVREDGAGGVGEYEIEAADDLDDGLELDPELEWVPDAEPVAAHEPAAASSLDDVPLFQQERERDIVGDGSTLPDMATLDDETWAPSSELSLDGEPEVDGPAASALPTDAEAIPPELRDVAIPTWALPRRAADAPKRGVADSSGDEVLPAPELTVKPDHEAAARTRAESDQVSPTRVPRTSLFDGLEPEDTDARANDPDEEFRAVIEAAEASVQDPELVTDPETVEEVAEAPDAAALPGLPDTAELTDPAQDVYLVGEFSGRTPAEKRRDASATRLDATPEDPPFRSLRQQEGPEVNATDGDNAAFGDNADFSDNAAASDDATAGDDASAGDAETLDAVPAWDAPDELLHADDPTSAIEDAYDEAPELAAPVLAWSEDEVEDEEAAAEPAARPTRDPLDPTAPMSDRVFSSLADALVVGLIGVVLSVAGASAARTGVSAFVQAAPVPFVLAWLLFAYSYGVFFVGTCGQTLGKMAMRVRVIDADNFQVGYLKAATRALGYTLSALPAGLGLILALRHPEQRALHDRLSGTRVVKA